MGIPRVYISKIRLKNFKRYQEHEISFQDLSGRIFPLFGFFGPNGCGKTTVLDAITLTFCSFSSYDPERLRHQLGSSCIRHFQRMSVVDQETADFLVEASIVTSDGRQYEIAITRNGFQKDHPDDIKPTLVRQCFKTRYDEELNTFQLRKDRWDMFKDLFETVTGFRVEKRECPMSPFTISSGENRRMACLDEFVLSLGIFKGDDEEITDRECSKGEKKIIKNFTTLLNKEFIPSVILIDDIEMHVERSRHVQLLRCIERCFPKSQILFTTHSPSIVLLYNLERTHDLTIGTPLENVLWRKNLIRGMERLDFFPMTDEEAQTAANIKMRLRTQEDLDFNLSLAVVSSLSKNICERSFSPEA